MQHATPLEQRARTWLGEAVRAGDTVTVSALRTVLGAIASAEAVPAPQAAAGASEHVAGSSVGVGSTEAPRRELTDDDVAAVVRAEIDERHAAIEAMGGHGERADRLRAEISVLESLLGGAR